MPTSILDTIKKMLGLDPDYTAFDVDIIVGINTAFMTLTQIGVGPSSGFLITGKSESWADFLSTLTNLEAIKTYIYLKVKAVFDPPGSSHAVEAMSRLTTELEWRLNSQVEPTATEIPPLEP